MKVYLLVLDYAVGGEHDCNVEVYLTRAKAHDAMLRQFEYYQQEYYDSYDESNIVCEEPTDKGACLYLASDYAEKHDEWSIIEKEVIE